jgi:AcrR family transcriptional regulator
MSVSERRKGMSGDGAVAPGTVAPLYQRLPRGPHQLGPQAVAHHQRIRMHGAMVEAVATSGYGGTSVKQVIGLAGVSRRAFYEQFANKEECFLATFDLIAARGVARISQAYRASEGGLEARLRAAFDQFSREVTTNSKAAVLTVVEAQTAGAAGQLRLRRATATFERMLSESFARSPGAIPLPIPVVRGIVGGLHEATSRRLREQPIGDIPTLAGEMLDWTLLFQASATERMATHLAARVPAMVQADSVNNGRGSVDAGTPSTDIHSRLLQSVLQLAVSDDYQELTAPQIAEEARVPIEAFFELFPGRDECFLAAFDALGDELLLLVADPALVSSDWPAAVRDTISRLTRYLADRPLYARTITAEAFAAGPEMVERNLELAHSIATLLTEGAPEATQSELAIEGVAGAIWHTIRCQLASEQLHLLPALSDYLTYVVLAPFIGTEAAAEVVTEDRPGVGSGRSA